MNAVVVYSGGLDSSTLLYHLLAEGKEVLAVSVDYGQRHRIELERAAEICRERGVRHERLDLRVLLPVFGSSSLTDTEVPVPHGHYAEETMKQTVVPNRNMILLAVATARAIAVGATEVAYAAHRGDHTIYPDCRPEFAEAMRTAIGLADWHPVELATPFVHLTKAAIVGLGDTLGVPFGRTWSCYTGGERHCGRCGTCIERREAFFLADVRDPTEYEADAPTVDELLAREWKPET